MRCLLLILCLISRNVLLRASRFGAETTYTSGTCPLNWRHMRRIQFILVSVFIYGLFVVAPRQILGSHQLNQGPDSVELHGNQVYARKLTEAGEDHASVDSVDAFATTAPDAARLPATCRVAAESNSSNACHASCLACEATTGPRTRRPCKCCKAGFLPSKFNPARCDKCPSGFISSAGASKCTACPAGLTTTRSGSKTCDACQAGTEPVVRGKKRSCAPCADGFFSRAVIPFNKSAKCRPCPGGRTTTGAERARCGACRPGYGSPSCRICPKGTYSPGGPASAATRCISCPEGSSTPGTGATSAAACEVSPSPGPATSATVSIQASGSCNVTVGEALAATVRQAVANQTSGNEQFEVLVESCTVGNGTRSRALLQTGPVATFVIRIMFVIEVPLSNLQAVLESPGFVQTLVLQLQQLGRTLLGTDVKTNNPGSSPPPNTSPTPPPSTSPTTPSSPSVPSPPVLQPDPPVTPPQGPVTCRSRNYICTKGILIENVAVTSTTVLSDSLCCKPVTTPLVTVRMQLNESCDTRKERSMRTAVGLIANSRVGKEAGDVIYGAQCLTNSTQMSSSGRKLLESDSRMMFVFRTHGSAGEGVSKATLFSGVLMRVLGISNATDTSLAVIASRITAATVQGSPEAAAARATIESALSSAGIQANFTIEVQMTASCFDPVIPGAEWDVYCSDPEGALPGKICTGICPQSTAGVLYTTCQADGTWSAPTGRCVPLSESPNLPCNGSNPAQPYANTWLLPARAGSWPNCSEGTAVCEATCGRGYKDYPRPYSKCDKTTGLWSNPINRCETSYCRDQPEQGLVSASWPFRCWDNLVDSVCYGTCKNGGRPPAVRCLIVPNSYYNQFADWVMIDNGNCVGNYAMDATCRDLNGAESGKPAVICPDGFKLTLNVTQSVANMTSEEAQEHCCLPVYPAGATCNNTLLAPLECGLGGRKPGTADTDIGGFFVNSTQAKATCCRPDPPAECPLEAQVFVKDDITGPILECQSPWLGCPNEYPFRLLSGSSLRGCLPAQSGAANCTMFPGYTGPPTFSDGNWTGCTAENTTACPMNMLSFISVTGAEPLSKPNVTLDSCHTSTAIELEGGSCSDLKAGSTAGYSVNLRAADRSIKGCAKLSDAKCPASHPLFVADVAPGEENHTISDCFQGVNSCTNMVFGGVPRSFPLYDGTPDAWPATIPTSPPIAGCITKPATNCPASYPAEVFSSTSSSADNVLVGCLAENRYTFCPALYPMVFIYAKVANDSSSIAVNSCRPSTTSCRVPGSSTVLIQPGYSVALKDADGNSLKGCKDTSYPGCFGSDTNSTGLPYEFPVPLTLAGSVLVECRAAASK